VLGRFCVFVRSSQIPISPFQKELRRSLLPLFCCVTLSFPCKSIFLQSRVPRWWVPEGQPCWRVQRTRNLPFFSKGRGPTGKNSRRSYLPPPPQRKGLAEDITFSGYFFSFFFFLPSLWTGWLMPDAPPMVGQIKVYVWNVFSVCPFSFSFPDLIACPFYGSGTSFF